MNLDIKGKNLTCQQLQALNDADLTTQCILNTVNQAVTNDTFQAVSAQKSDILGSLTALFSAPILILIAILLAIGAIFLLFRLFRRSTPTEQPLQQGGETVAPEIEVNSVPEVNTVPEVTLETPETPTPASLSQLYRRSRRAPRSGASVGRSNVSYHKRY